MHTGYILIAALVALLLLRTRTEGFKAARRTFIKLERLVDAVEKRLERGDKYARANGLTKRIYVSDTAYFNYVVFEFSGKDGFPHLGAVFKLKKTLAKTKIASYKINVRPDEIVNAIKVRIARFSDYVSVAHDKRALEYGLAGTKSKRTQ